MIDLTRPIVNEKDYESALEEYDRLFHINDCCAVPDYGSKLYDLIKTYEETFH